MNKEKIFYTANMKKAELENYYDFKLTNEEFAVILEMAISDTYELVLSPSSYDYRFEPFYEYLLAINNYGRFYTDRSKAFKRLKNPEHYTRGVDLYKIVRKEIVKKFPEIKIKEEQEHEKLMKKYKSIGEDNNKDTTISYKQKQNNDSPVFSNIKPVLIWIALAVGLFLLFNWAVDPSIDGGPKFFGHDGG